MAQPRPGSASTAVDCGFGVSAASSAHRPHGSFHSMTAAQPLGLRAPPPHPWQGTQAPLVLGEPLLRRGSGAGAQSPAHSLLHIWASNQGMGASSHLCSLKYREPLEVLMGGVRGAAATVARPGSSFSCVLNREGLTVGSLSLA